MMQAVLQAGVSAEAGTQSRGQQLPLTFLKAGEKATVLKVRGSGEMHHHLENLGFVPGAAVCVMCESGGNVIVDVKGAQVGLDRTAASKIITA